MQAKSGYHPPRFDGYLEYRAMTVDEAQNLPSGTSIMFLDRNGDVRDCRVSGKPKTWKTRPGHVRVPIKYGMYENTYAESYGESQLDPVMLPSGKPIIVFV